MGKCCSKLPNHATSTPLEQICRIDGARIDSSSSSAPFQMDCTPSGHCTVPSAQLLDMDGLRDAEGRQTNMELELLKQKLSRSVRFRGYKETLFMDDSPTSAPMVSSSTSGGLNAKIRFQRTRSCGSCSSCIEEEEEEERAAAAAGLDGRQHRFTTARRRRSYNGTAACTAGHDDTCTSSTSTMHLRGAEQQLIADHYYNKCDEITKLTHRDYSSINIDEETWSSALLMLSSDNSASTCSKMHMMMQRRPLFHQDGAQEEEEEAHPHESGHVNGDPSQLGRRHTESGLCLSLRPESAVAAANHEEKVAEVEEEEEEDDDHHQRLQTPVVVGGDGDHIFLQLLQEEEEEEEEEEEDLLLEKKQQEQEEEHLFSLLLGHGTDTEESSSSSPALLPVAAAAASTIVANFSSRSVSAATSSSSLPSSSPSSSPFLRMAPSSKMSMPSSSPADSIPIKNDDIHRASPFFLASYLYPALMPSQSSAPSSHQSSGCNTPLKEFEFKVKCCNSAASTPMFSPIKSRGNAEAAVMEQLTSTADALTVEEIAEIWRVFEQSHACS